MFNNFYEGRNVLITGGASFIGSHLVDKLASLGAQVTVIDNLSSGKLENLKESWNIIKFIQEDLEYIKLEKLTEIFKGHEIVFHLAATHGGRGYPYTSSRRLFELLYRSSRL